MATSLLVLVLLLVSGFVGTRLATLLRLPHSVFLVVLGGAAGLWLRSHGHLYIEELRTLFPDVVLYLLLPPLVFESSIHLDAKLLRRDVVPISALAVVVMLGSTLLVGYGLHWVFGADLLPALTFGALISATDPVAVVALFKEVGAPRRLATLVESESLLNDGTALVLFRVLLALTLAHATQLGVLPTAVMDFVKVTVGGLVVGAVVAVIGRALLRFTAGSASAQLGLTVATAYVSYLAAELGFHASGVIATMTAGVIVAQTARRELNREAAAGLLQFWELIALTGNTVVFALIGMSIDPGLLSAGAALLPLTILIVLGARALSVFTVIPLVNRLKVAPPVPLGYQAVLVWGGLRGGLALAMALLLPETFPEHRTFFALTLGVVLSTLIVNAMTTGPVLRLLGLDRLDAEEVAFSRRIVERLREAAFRPLLAEADAGSLSRPLVEAQRSLAPAAEGPEVGAESQRRIALSEILLQEQHLYEHQLQDGLLSRQAYVDLSALVNERLDALQSLGYEALEGYLFPMQRESRLERLLVPSVRRLARRLEVLVALRLTLAEVAQRTTEPAGLACLAGWRKAVDVQLGLFYEAHARDAGAVQALFVAESIRSRSTGVLAELLKAGLVSQAVAGRAEQEIEAYHRRICTASEPAPVRQ